MTVSPRSLLAVFSVHFVFLVIIWSLLPKSLQESRSNDYKFRSEPVARNYVEGRGFREANGDLMTRYPPGHPWFLILVFQTAAALGVSETIVLAMFGIACQAASGMFLFLLASEICSRRTAFVISLLLLTYPPPLYLTLLGNNEVPYTPVFVITAWVGWMAFKHLRGWQFFVFGVLLGLGMLIRPFALGLPVFLFLLCLTPYIQLAFGKRVVLAGLLMLGTVVAILPWQLFTYHHTKKFYLVSSIGVAGALDGFTYGVDRPNRVPMELPPGVLKLQQSAFEGWQNGTIDDFGGLLSWIKGRAIEQPRDLASMIWRKAMRAWYATDSHRWESKLLMLQTPYLLLCFMGTLLCYRSGGKLARMATFVLVITLFFWAMTTAGPSIMRYAVPLMPLLLLLTAPVVERVMRKLGLLEREIDEDRLAAQES